MAGVLVSTATAYSNQRKLDRCQNGVLWALVSKEAYHLIYSTDDGKTWTDYGNIGGSGGNYVENASLFIDLDDYLHIVYKNGFNGYITYLRGTPNAARTAWTLSPAATIRADALGDYPDVIAHREGTGWKAHIVASRHDTTTTDNTLYYPITIDSAGTITVGVEVSIGGVYGNTVAKFPSIDFRHTGDGKTVSANGPDLFVAWSAGATGAGLGIRFRKAVYSAGSWTWNAEREIDANQYVDNGSYRWLNCLFDGTRVLLGYVTYTGADIWFILKERDVGDTATTGLYAFNAVGGSAGDYVPEDGSMSYDAQGNVYFIGRYHEGPDRNPVGYRRWVRSTSTMEPFVLGSTELNHPVYASAKRGSSFARIEWIYTSGNNAPYQVKYDVLRTGTGVRVWNGSAWTVKPVKEWNGSAWVPRELKYWNGSVWVPA